MMSCFMFLFIQYHEAMLALHIISLVLCT
uniref:Uncharacterized protein n=1 Tax=Arundo donax TaxID=35708 RepID=A0A0A8ZUZ2_ARUDO